MAKRSCVIFWMARMSSANRHKLLFGGYEFAADDAVESPDALQVIEADLAAHKCEPGGWAGFIPYSGNPCFFRFDNFVHHTLAAHKPVSLPRGPLNFAIDKSAYLSKIEECLRLIRAGESYEICLTNQLTGATTADPFTYYQNLTAVNPAPHSAYIEHPDFQIACSSPELFLKITAEGHVTSKPIKGTIARTADPELLRNDEKTRAENLMITDLIRNDLGRVCKTGTVRVPKLFDIETFATVHHMVSTIEGDLKPECAAIDCLRAAFPPGSMTGAPKIRTMEIIDRLETQPRGLYSGCVGYFTYTGEALFNVVIRSAVFSQGRVSIGTGGAIVAQSDPEKEWDELVLKTAALQRAFHT
jgi:para-aminobenzoate synthetase